MSKKTSKKKTLDELLEEALVPEEEQPYEVPENWIWTRLESVCEYIQRGKSPKYVDFSNVKVVSQKCVQWNKFDINPARFIDEKTLTGYKEERFLRKNDLLWNSTGTGTIGRVAIVQDELEGIVVADSHVTVVRPVKGFVNSGLLYRWLTSPYVQNKLNNAWSGSTNQVELNLTTVKNHLIPIPPIKEQKRISEKVENLLNKINEAKQLMEGAKETFKLRRAAILDKAFRGELTAKWREENQETIIKKNINIHQQDQLFHIPAGWRWVSFGEIVKEAKLGIVKSQKEQSIQYKYVYLKMNNITSKGKLDLKETVNINVNDKELKQYMLQKNDFLFNTRNSIELVGKNAVLDYQPLEPMLFNNNILRVRFLENINPNLINYYLQSHMGKSMLNELKSGTTNVAAIYAKDLYKLMIPVPLLEEQRVLVKNIKTLLTKDEKVEQIITELSSVFNKMEKSILSKAFSGQLGTNDPTEESAIELLKEVLQEKQ